MPSTTTEFWPDLDFDGEYMIDDIFVMADLGFPLARWALNFIGQKEYRDALQDPDTYPLLSDDGGLPPTDEELMPYRIVGSYKLPREEG